jgi:cytochrome c
MAAPANDAELKAYGKRLSSQCTTCHRIDGIDNGIPSIVGWPAEDFMFVLKAYRYGGRTDPEMVRAAQSLNEKQMQALASYFGSLKGSRRLR